jgi:NAD(P)-dependent dehydrogenase (short-subunit alcohol dehydrogenase family)
MVKFAKVKLFGAAVLILLLTMAALEAHSMSAAAQKPTVLVTGSNRGIGLEFVRQYAAKGWHVIATTRRPAQADDLQRLAKEHSNIVIELLDVADDDHLAALAQKYTGQPIDVLINNAGVSGDFQGSGQSFGTLDYTTVDTFMSVNAISPLRVTEAFYENIKAGQQKKVVAITALLGVHSFQYGNFDGAYWYKVSKAAMNAAMYNLAREVLKDGVVVALLTPGEVAVEKVENPGPEFISPEVSINGMIDVIAALTLDDAGAIIRYNGKRYQF